ncbi:hypothetical protein NEIPOLOT_01307 [Neisseria polysaccharea ATCC 43768]|nr:hypothetical protein NEIPOLOT_01307 [Neisseria polysaccharea ATCC 43768]
MTELKKTGFPFSRNDGILGFCFSVFVGMTNLNIVGIYRKFNIPP